ncbi:MAG: M48 family metalloprotease [Prevotellaceae bacterium]|jgi:Zn-dependent protease with chaperone function|nr:M48 family metalloprotease [Prevotellaceae bacterium]
MKKVTTVIIMLLCTVAIFAAKPRDISGLLTLKGELKQTYQSYPKGEPLIVSQVVEAYDDGTTRGYIQYIINIGHIQYGLTPKEFSRYVTLAPAESDTEFWQQVYLNERIYEYFFKKGYRNNLRQEANEECRKYLEQIDTFLCKDDFVNSYVQNIFAKIITGIKDSKRHEALNVRVVQALDPEAYMLTNGSMIVSTGMLALLDSDEELAAIMSNELAHYVMDDPIDNIRRSISRNNRSHFWGAFLTGFAEGMLDSGYYYDDLGSTAVGTVAAVGAVSVLLSAKAIDFLGLSYNEKQDVTADRIACDWLAFKQMKPEALSSALSKITWFYVARGTRDKLARYESAERLRARIKQLPQPEKELKSRAYLRAMTDIVSSNALGSLEEKQYKAAIELAQKNIDNKFPSDHDYVVLVKAKMALDNTAEVNDECMALLEKAKVLGGNVANLDINKQEILLLLRMNKQLQAAHALEEYLSLLDMRLKEGGDEAWTKEETTWAQQLLAKINRI